MAGNSEMIREFLVGLGFKTDEKSLKKFEHGIKNATKSVVKLVGAIEGAALTVAAGVSRFASNIEEMYYAAERTNSTVTNLKALDYAARNLGASSGSARAAVEGLAKFMRDTPAAEGFLESLGVQTRDAKGNLRDTTSLLVDLGAKFKNMPFYQARQYANFFGIDDTMLMAMRSGQMSRFMAEYRKTVAGSGMDAAGRSAHAFMMTLRKLGAEFDSLWIRVQAALMQKLGPQMAQFSNWFQNHIPEIAGNIADLAMSIIDAANAIMPVLTAILHAFTSLDGATGGLASKVVILGVALKMTGVLGALTAVIKAMFTLASMSGRLTGLIRAMGLMSRGAGILVGVLGKLGAVAAAGELGWLFGKWLNGKINEGVSWLTDGKENSLGGLAYSTFNPGANHQPAMAGGAGKNVTIHQQTTVNAIGGDAGSTARAVAGEQGRVNADLARNAATAVR